MKKIFITAIAATFALTSCESFLDSSNYTQANSENFPVIESDLNKEVSSLYAVMNEISKNPLTSPYFYNVILGDEINGAGGDGDTEVHALGHLMATDQNYYSSTYTAIYKGIARASAILNTPESILKNLPNNGKQLMGEAHFMRGLYYLWAVQTWGDVPAYWAVSAPDPCPQQSAENVIMPRIIEDFKKAYDLMEFGGTTQGDGHATKGAAAGFLARAYMFYQGFYKNAGELAKADLAPVTVEATKFSITKDEVVDCLEKTIASGQYDLIDDFRQLWAYTNEYTAKDYAFVSDLAKDGKYWAGNGNKEQLFQIQFCNSANYNSYPDNSPNHIGMGFVNQMALYCSLRCDESADGHKDAYGSAINGAMATFPGAQGWGQGTINANAYEDWSDKDPRKAASVLNVETELEDYKYTTTCTEDAGLYNKKIMEFTTKATADANQTEGPYTWWGIPREAAGQTNSNGNCMQGDHFADAILMRYADVLLMHAELTGDRTQLNKVQRRAGVTETPYTLTNIKNERRWEFFGEGIRFNDLRRWSGKNGGANCEAAQALEKQNGSKVNYQGRWTTMHHGASSWAQRYAETDGFLPIPSSQINIVNDPSVLKQNAGWGDDVADWNMTNTPAY